MFRKASTQKQKAYDFFNSYEGEKVTRPTFYYRVRLGGTETWEEKIKLKIHNQYRRRDNTPKGKRATEMTRYNEQPEPKASKTLFRNRLNCNYPKEEAILMGEKWDAVKRGQTKQPQPAKPYVPKKIVPKPVDGSDFKIEITYPSEVAKVFRREYVRMIEQIEWDLTYTDEKTQVCELNQKLERLHKELEIFNSYNH